MGHIELAAPVSHIWYFRGVPSRISLMADISPKELEQVLYFVSHIVLDPGEVPEIHKNKSLPTVNIANFAKIRQQGFPRRNGCGSDKRTSYRNRPR